MTVESETERSEEVALFRYGLIADLTHSERGQRGMYALLKKKAVPSYTIPGSRRSRVAPETIRGWLSAFRKGGFDALRPKQRADHGRSRAIQRRWRTFCAVSRTRLLS